MYGDSYQEARKQRLSFAKNRCETCKHDGSINPLECHHPSAEAYWLDEREELTMADVVILCSKCHNTLTVRLGMNNLIQLRFLHLRERIKH